MFSTSWHSSRPSSDNTHHVQQNGERLYTKNFVQVLPFHPPGIAPVQDCSGSYHIDEHGEPIYSQRFTRTFGFYEGLASVIDQSGKYYHILPTGKCAYTQPAKFDWTGNFQQNRCVVRVAATSKTGRNEYYHIGPDGDFLEGGPYEYAGDYREGYAVVRSKTGLCHHVDLHGKKIYCHAGFLDLDVFHKGFARAKDGSGWFHIDTSGQDISHGERFSEIEPFYNGMALAKRVNGDRVVIDEHYQVASKIKNPEIELQNKIHSLCVAFWPSFALKLGLEIGLADQSVASLATKMPTESYKALVAAWLDLGLLESQQVDVVQSEMGRRLKSGLQDRFRADYWLGLQMTPWLEATKRFHTPLSHKDGNSFFDSVSADSVALMHKVLLSYAQDDWKEVVDKINFTGVSAVVDIGGGFGYLADNIHSKYSHIECVVIEKAEVVEAYMKNCPPGSKINFVVGDLFSGSYPHAQLYILSRILHDWADEDAKAILAHLNATLPCSNLLVIDRIKNNHSSHGMLQLNMLLTTGGTERSEEEFDDLYSLTGWKRVSTSYVNPNCSIMRLEKQ